MCSVASPAVRFGLRGEGTLFAAVGGAEDTFEETIFTPDPITYVDATDGPSGNTVIAADDSEFNAAVNSDVTDNWNERDPFANGKEQKQRTTKKNKQGKCKKEIKRNKKNYYLKSTVIAIFIEKKKKKKKKKVRKSPPLKSTHQFIFFFPFFFLQEK
eukprot:TRINITY_DN33637_c0_g1_i1.p2 TRINITY_DN33637_c0_g1~~TRINITY_DN33637_c0_g1_i1.p2  ORF type:complete len:157 (+),score=18.89 TRINITY_DN33637_c0_g1_i1:86-556(+)